MATTVPASSLDQLPRHWNDRELLEHEPLKMHLNLRAQMPDLDWATAIKIALKDDENKKEFVGFMV